MATSRSAPRARSILCRKQCKQRLRASLKIGNWAPSSILWVIVGLCPQLNKKTLQSTCFFGPNTQVGDSDSTKTSINAAEIRRALGVNADDSTDSLLEFNIDNPGGFCNKEAHFGFDQKGIAQVVDHCLMASTEHAYGPGTIRLFYQGMVYAARVSLNESHRNVIEYKANLLTIRTICFSREFSRRVLGFVPPKKSGEEIQWKTPINTSIQERAHMSSLTVKAIVHSNVAAEAQAQAEAEAEAVAVRAVTTCASAATFEWTIAFTVKEDM